MHDALVLGAKAHNALIILRELYRVDCTRVTHEVDADILFDALDIFPDVQVTVLICCHDVICDMTQRKWQQVSRH